jgi:serine/threonine protein kinase
VSQSNKGGDIPGDGDEPVADATPPTRPRDADLVPDTIRKLPDPSDDTRQPNPGEPVLPVPARKPDGASASPLPFSTGSGKRSAALSVARTSLDSERILRDAPRIAYEGADCPSLGGIALLAKLGEGGMGTVYYGIHPRLNAEVAVKVLPFHLAERDPTLINRFIREAQIAAHVRSPHLVHVLDVNQDKGLYFLVMEYVCGLTGAKALGALRRLGKIGLEQLDAVTVCIAAAKGLKAAHERGVVHRDIKPDNIIIPYRLPSDDLLWSDAKLMDLGLARMEQHEGTGLTATESSMGTPGYMSPEQAMDAKSATHRSDIFSMGATLYGLLAGRSPFQRESAMKTLFATVHEPCAPLTNFRAELHPNVAAIVDRCLSKEPERRYENVDAFLEEMLAIREALVVGMLPLKRTSVAGPATSHDTALLPNEGKKAPEDTNSTFIRTNSKALLAAGKAPPSTNWAARKRNAILGAAALCALLLLGTGYVVTHMSHAMSPEKLQIFRAEHARNIKRARSNADEGQFMEAGAQLEMASRLGLEDPDARNAERDAQNYITEKEKSWTQKYQQQLVAFDAIIESQALENAPGALEELKKYAPRDGSDNKTIALKEQALKSLQDLRSREENTGRALDEAAISDPETALSKLKEIAVNLDTPAMKVSKARPQLAGRLDELLRKKAAAKDNFDKQRATDLQKQEFGALLAAADEELKLDGKLNVAEAQMNNAAKLFPEDPELAKRRERLEQLKTEKKRNETIAANLKSAGELIDKGSWDEAETLLKDVDALAPDNAAVAQLRKKSGDLQAEALRKASEKEKREQADALLSKVDALLADNNLPEAAKRLESASAIDAANPNLKARQDRLAARKAEQQQQFETLLREANGFLANDAQLAEAEKRIDSASKLIPDDPRVKPLRDKFNEAKTAALERERTRQERAKLAQDLKMLEETFPAADDPNAEKKLEPVKSTFATIEAAHPGDALLDGTRDKMQQRQREIEHVRFAALVREADGLIARDVSAAEKKLKAAEAQFPKDPLLEPVRQRLNARVVELRKNSEFEALLGDLDRLFADNASMAEINAKYNQVVKIYPDSPKLEPYRARIAEASRRTEFAELLNAAAQQMRRDDQLDNAAASLAAAAKLYPQDERLADARRALSGRRIDAQQRAERIAFLNKLKADVEDLMGSQEQLLQADRMLSAAARNYPNETFIDSLRERVAVRRQQLQTHNTSTTNTTNTTSVPDRPIRRDTTSAGPNANGGSVGESVPGE